jgi:hypothetical protein
MEDVSRFKGERRKAKYENAKRKKVTQSYSEKHRGAQSFLCETLRFS